MPGTPNAYDFRPVVAKALHVTMFPLVDNWIDMFRYYNKVFEWAKNHLGERLAVSKFIGLLSPT